MNRRKWSEVESPLILAVKLCEEAGEVSKALLDAIACIPEDDSPPAQADACRRRVLEIVEECDQVEFIARCLKSLGMEIGRDESWEDLRNAG